MITMTSKPISEVRNITLNRVTGEITYAQLKEIINLQMKSQTNCPLPSDFGVEPIIKSDVFCGLRITYDTDIRLEK